MPILQYSVDLSGYLICYTCIHGVLQEVGEKSLQDKIHHLPHCPLLSGCPGQMYVRNARLQLWHAARGQGILQNSRQLRRMRRTRGSRHLSYTSSYSRPSPGSNFSQWTYFTAADSVKEESPPYRLGWIVLKSEMRSIHSEEKSLSFGNDVY